MELEEAKAGLQSSVQKLQEELSQQCAQYDGKIADLQQIIQAVKDELKEAHDSLASTQAALGELECCASPLVDKVPD